MLSFSTGVKKPPEERWTKITPVPHKAYFDSLAQTLGDAITWRRTFLPELMRKPLWERNKEIGKISDIKVRYDEKKRIKSIVGYDKDGNPVRADFTKVQGADFLTGQISFSYKGKEEARISLMFIENRLHSSLIYVPNPSLSVNFTISDPSPDIRFGPEKSYGVSITLGDKTIHGRITPAMKSPRLLMELKEILKEVEGTAQIAALNPVFIAVMGQGLPAEISEVVKEKKSKWRKVLCAFGTGVSDAFGPFVTGGYGAVNVWLLD